MQNFKPIEVKLIKETNLIKEKNNTIKILGAFRKISK